MLHQRHQILTLFCTLVGWALLLLGCASAEEPVSPTVMSQVIPTPIVIITPTAGLTTTVGPTIETATSIPDVTITIGLTAEPAVATTLAPLPVCQIVTPQGWEPYVVRGGDTLFKIAVARQPLRLPGDVVNEIKAVNCRTNDIIYSGETLIVPMGPAVSPTSTASFTPTALPQATTPAATALVMSPTPTCTSPFLCGDGSGLDLTLAPGGPNGTDFVPCSTKLGVPWIAVSKPTIEVGERVYLYACEFPGTVMTATLTLANSSTQLLTLDRFHPNLDLTLGTAEAVMVWNSLPTYSPGTYSLVVQDDQGNQNSVPGIFTVNPATQPHILTIPQSGPGGTSFQVYLVNFRPGTTVVAFYAEEAPVLGSNHTLVHRDDLTVTVSGDGTGFLSLSAPANAPAAAYGLSDAIQLAYDLFWVR